MRNAEFIVDSMLGAGDQNISHPLDGIDLTDVKAVMAAVADAEEADALALKASGVVSPKTVSYGSSIWHIQSGARARVTSVKTWKTRPSDFVIGWKHGLYTYGKVTPSSAGEWTTIEPPVPPKRRR